MNLKRGSVFYWQAGGHFLTLALQDNTSGSDNIGIGVQAGSAFTTTESQNIDIGNSGVAGENSTTRIGTLQTRTFIAGIHGVSEGGSGILPVYINSQGPARHVRFFPPV